MTTNLSPDGKELKIGSGSEAISFYAFESRDICLIINDRDFVIYDNEIIDLIAFLTYHRNRVRNG